MSDKRVLNPNELLLPIKHFFILALLCLPCFAFAQNAPALSHQADPGVLTYSITTNADKSFGYDIFRNGKLLVHQPTIPGRPGMNGFKSKSDAEKVAKLMISKIKKGMMPPTVEEKELKAFKI